MGKVAYGLKLAIGSSKLTVWGSDLKMCTRVDYRQFEKYNFV